MKKNRAQYEAYLNCIDMPEVSFWMGGKLRSSYFHRGLYGTCLRKHDPIAFNVGFSEWRRGR